MRRGRPGTGVEVLKTSIRVRFTYKGIQHTINLRVTPTQANIKAAERLMVRVRREIDLDIFEFQRHFPKSTEALQASFAAFAEAWLGQLEQIPINRVHSLRP